LVWHAAPKYMLQITQNHRTWAEDRRFHQFIFNWARMASISFTTLTGNVWYYPDIHLEGMRKPTKSLNITCTQAVILQSSVPCYTFLQGYVSIKYWSIIILMYPITYVNSVETKSEQRNFTKRLFVA
jgi:hypothetical protein